MSGPMPWLLLCAVLVPLLGMGAKLYSAGPQTVSSRKKPCISSPRDVATMPGPLRLPSLHRPTCRTQPLPACGKAGEGGACGWWSGRLRNIVASTGIPDVLVSLLHQRALAVLPSSPPRACLAQQDAAAMWPPIEQLPNISLIITLLHLPPVAAAATAGAAQQLCWPPGCARGAARGGSSTAAAVGAQLVVLELVPERRQAVDAKVLKHGCGKAGACCSGRQFLQVVQAPFRCPSGQAPPLLRSPCKSARRASGRSSLPCAFLNTNPDSTASSRASCSVIGRSLPLPDCSHDSSGMLVRQQGACGLAALATRSKRSV